MASGTIIAGLLIRACMIALLQDLQVSLLNRDAEHPSPCHNRLGFVRHNTMTERDGGM